MDFRDWHLFTGHGICGVVGMGKVREIRLHALCPDPAPSCKQDTKQQAAPSSLYVSGERSS